ncbi:unnamed protein product [Phytomonas sp. EM1]|nr:unnamed protein product [Phytomonas sp. EM1]|eukprot:CCW63379.1 unnamed protein product [Phytomonas sp. isolate EM1]
MEDSISQTPMGGDSDRDLALQHERLIMDKLALVRDMLGKVISRAKIYGDATQRRRYADYSPEDVYRAVRMLVDEKRSACLQEMLEEFLKDYMACLTEQLSRFAHECGLSNPSSCSTDPAVDVFDDIHEGPSVASLLAGGGIPVRCFHTVMEIWESFSFAMGELQVVWSPFACRYVMTATVFKGILGATVSFLMDAFNEVPMVFEAALEGFLRLMRAHVEVDSAPPLILSPETKPEEGKRAKTEEEEATRARKEDPSSQAYHPPLSCLHRFTEMLFITQRYVQRLQPMVVAMLAGFYRAAAAWMLSAGLPSRAYFDYVKRAMLREKQRASAYLHPQTAVLLQEVVERELLGEVGMELLRRDFASLLSGDAQKDEEEGLATLALVWRLLSRSTQVSKDPLVGMFRAHIEATTTGFVVEIVRLQRVEGAGGAEACRRAVHHLLHFIARARRAVVRCFPQDQKLFRIQIDEGLQVVLNKYQRPVAEQLAAFVDHVFARVESGELPLEERRVASEVGSPVEIPSAKRSIDFLAREEAGGEALPVLASGRAFLEQVSFTCVHFSSNDIFGHLHWQDLARRLLNPNRAVNLSAERCFLRLFEGIYGSSFIYKFEGMLKDKESSADHTQQYEAWAHSKGAMLQARSANLEQPSPQEPQGGVHSPLVVSPVDFDGLPNLAGMKLNLFFMASGFWPKRQDAMNLQLPPPLQRLTGNVELFYQILYPNRYLTWQHHLSHGVLRAQLTPGGVVCELSGTLIQCIVLMHLDELSRADSAARFFSVKELCQKLGLDLDIPEVAGSLMGLCQEEFPILIRTNAAAAAAFVSSSSLGGGVGGGEGGGLSVLSPQHYLQLNTAFSFTTPHARLPFPLGATKVEADLGAEDASAVVSEEQLWQQHGHLLQVSIIQYVKPKGTAKHDELLAYMSSQKYNFEFSDGLAKRAIEKLLDRGFIERSGRDQYKYVA